LKGYYEIKLKENFLMRTCEMGKIKQREGEKTVKEGFNSL